MKMVQQSESFQINLKICIGWCILKLLTSLFMVSRINLTSLVTDNTES